MVKTFMGSLSQKILGNPLIMLPVITHNFCLRRRGGSAWKGRIFPLFFFAIFAAFFFARFSPRPGLGNPPQASFAGGQCWFVAHWRRQTADSLLQDNQRLRLDNERLGGAVRQLKRILLQAARRMGEVQVWTRPQPAAPCLLLPSRWW